MKSRSGLTIVEILVTISVMAILSSILIVYNRTSERQLVLFKEQARLVSTLSRAKGMAMSLLREPPNDDIPCGYGLNISKSSSSYLIFKDLPPAGGCENSDNGWSGSSESFGDVVQIDSAIEIDSASSTLTEVFFIPPDPRVILNGNPNLTEEQTIVLKIKGTDSKKVIKVNKAGQITIYEL